MCRKRRLQSSLEVTSPPLQRKREATSPPLQKKRENGQVHTRSTKSICPCLSKANPIISYWNNESVDSSSDVEVDPYFSDISSNDFSFSYSSEIRTVPEPQALLAGCHHCYMYFMVPNNCLFCPQCTGLLFDVRRRIQN